MLKRIRLADLDDNPFRDFKVDPLDEKSIADLVQSIGVDGFWGGVTARRYEERYQIGCGHHRVQAAREVGMEFAEIYIGNFDDAAMVRVLAKENATQRGDDGQAVMGSVAATVRFLAKVLLLSPVEALSPNGDSEFFPNDHAKTKAKERLLSDDGLGERSVLYFLRDYSKVPITNRAVREELTTLKASTHYARIIKEVQQQIEQEARETEQHHHAAERAKVVYQQEQAKLAAVHAAAKAKTFDLDGVRQHLKTADHVQTFFKLVTKPRMLEMLPVEKQAELAAHLVQQAAVDKVRLTSSYIHKFGFGMAEAATHETQQEEKREEERKQQEEVARQAREENVRSQINRIMNGVGQNARGFEAYVSQLIDLDNSEGLVQQEITANDYRLMLNSMQRVEATLKAIRALGFKPEKLMDGKSTTHRLLEQHP